MIFCLDHSDRAVEIGEILSEALTLSETTFNKKLGRLFLVSDVLCNCNTAKIKNASLYRSEFKNKHLSQIFKSLYKHSQNLLIKEKVIKVIKVWENKCVFPSFFTSQLKQIFIFGDFVKEKKEINPTKKQQTIKKSKQIEIDKEKNKNLIYPPHSKLFIAKKTNNPNKAFTSYSFAKLNKKPIHHEKPNNVFMNMLKNNNDKKKEPQQQSQNHSNSTFPQNVTPGKYDGEPLPEHLCINIDLL